jgi:hypothetical protein
MIATVVHLITERRSAMLWAFILVVGLAIVLVKLGVYSMLVGVLSVGLKLALLVIAVLTIVLVWYRVIGAKKSN